MFSVNRNQTYGSLCFFFNFFFSLVCSVPMGPNKSTLFNTLFKFILTQVEGRKLTFMIEVFDEQEKIGEALHERFIINADKFMQKVAAKATARQ